jgi:acyl carrier protein phosphodiesterase
MIYAEMTAYAGPLDERIRLGLHHMATDDWLGSYASIEGTAVTLRRMSHRLSRPNLLGEAAAELSAHYVGLRQDFYAFFPRLRAHTQMWQEQQRHSG